MPHLRYYHGHCSKELPVLIPPPAALHHITRSSTTGHPYCVQLTKCRTNRFTNSFTPQHIQTLEFPSRDGYEPISNNMQVHVQSRLPGSHPKCITVDTSSSATVESVISSFCVQRGITRTPHLILRNGTNEPLKHSATLEAEGILDGSLLFLEHKKQVIMSEPRWGLLAFIAMVIGGGGLLAVILLYVLTGGEIPFDYAVVIDAGSTHSQMLLYEWSGDKDSGTADVYQHGTCTVDGGIANMNDYAAIVPCVKNMVEIIPSASRAHSFLYLGATAGMRLLKLSSPRMAELTLLTLRCSLATTGIIVRKVDIISGVEEGVSAWITTNFILKTLHPKEKGSEPWISTFGSLDMGGASTQYAFAVNPDHAPNNSSLSKLRLYGHNYSIVADSYLCYGFNEASRRHRAMLITDLNDTKPIYDPCLPKGNVTFATAEQLFNQPCTRTTKFNVWLAENPNNKEKVFEFAGDSDYEKCSELVKMQLNHSVCQGMGFKECAVPPPLFLTETNFFAVSGFFYISSFLKSTNVTLDEFLFNLASWCSTTWPEMADLPLPPANRKMILTYCFGGNYITHWLTQMYGFDNSTWKNIIFQNKVGENDLGWALGFMINASNAIPEEAPTPPSLSTATFAVLLIICMLVIIISIILMRKFLIERRRRSDPEAHDTLIEA